MIQADRLIQLIQLTLKQLVDLINFPRKYSAELKDDGTEKLMVIQFIFTLQDNGLELRLFSECLFLSICL